MTEENQDSLTTGQQLTNLLLGADFLLRIILAVPWTIQTLKFSTLVLFVKPCLG